MAGVEIFTRSNLEDLLLTKPNIIFSTAVEFSEYVETVAVRYGETITQVLLSYCDTHDIEYEQLAKMLTRSIRDKIETEMQDSGLLPKTSVLELEFED